MKFKTTKKQINQNYNSVICIDYCQAQYLLNCIYPDAYNSGVYGWNADVYIIDGVAIVTGYRPWGNIRPDYKTMKFYDNAAAQILADSTMTCENRLNKVTQLLNQFIKEVTK